MQYCTPQGSAVRKYVQCLADEFCGVRERRWSTEILMGFMRVIIHTTTGAHNSQDIRQRITWLLELWEARKHAALLDDTVVEIRTHLMSTSHVSDEKKSSEFNSKVLDVNIREAVHSIYRQVQGGILSPENSDSKNGKTVTEVLRENQPALRTPDLTNPS